MKRPKSPHNLPRTTTVLWLDVGEKLRQIPPFLRKRQQLYGDGLKPLFATKAAVERVDERVTSG